MSTVISEQTTSTLLRWQISDANGNSATILNYGARLINWQSHASKQNNIIVGYKNIEDYLSDGAYMGAIAGPFANRISGASYQHKGKLINLGANEGSNHLHGGVDGLEKVWWECVSLQDDAITLRHQHTANSNGPGYPGDIEFLVSYKLLPDNCLEIKLSANASETVPIGPTGHAYFNLGDHTRNINQHALKLNAARFTPVDPKNIPTGDVSPVLTDFDFQSAKKVEIALDNNFVLNENTLGKAAAVLVCDASGVALEVFTDYPGIQVYTADHMSSPFVSRNAICLEPQFFPDSPNKPDFPFEFTSKDKPFSKTIRYRMSNVE